MRKRIVLKPEVQDRLREIAAKHGEDADETVDAFAQAVADLDELLPDTAPTDDQGGM